MDARERQRTSGKSSRNLAACWSFLLLALLGLAALVSPGCDSPCRRLASELCATAGDDEECARWQDRVGRVPTETCEHGLRLLERQKTVGR